MKRLLLAGSAMALSFVPTLAQAQADPEAGTPAGAAPGDTAQEEGLGADIVITAQRREESLQRAAIAVTALEGDTLTDAGITQATDLTRLVPSLQVAPASSFSQFYLRGVGTFGANAFAEQGVAINLDGIYLSRPAAPAGLFYDLARVEVLKGPQGTLYGRNATGGAVNVVTNRPELGELGGFVTAEYGNYDTLRASAAVNLPVGEQVAFRVAGQHAEHDGYYSDGYDDENTTAGRAAVAFDSGIGIDATLMVDFAHVGGQGSGGTIMPLLFDEGGQRLGPSDPRVIAEYLSRPPTPPVPQIIAQDDGYQDNHLVGIMAEINADLGFATLTVIPGWRRTDLDFRSYAGSFLIDVNELSEQFSLETRLAGDTGRLNWVVGAYYFGEDVVADQLFDQASNATLIQSNLETESFAAFGQATFSITDAFRVTGGLRYTRDNKQQNTYAETRPFVGFVPPGPPAFIPIILTIPTVAVTDVDFEEVTWKAGVEYDVGPRSLLYASVTTGFKSGILYVAQGRNFSDPETLTAYTVGSKNRFLGNTLQVNVEAFYWDYQDQQISHLGPVQVASTPVGPIFGPVFLTENAGDATLYGAELELLWQPTDNDLFGANIQYLHTNYESFTYQFYSTTGAPPVIGCPITPTSQIGASPQARIFDVDCAGRPLVNAPEWSLNLAYEHRFELGASGRILAGADTRIETSRFLSIDYLDLGRQDSYMMSNAHLTWESESANLAFTAFINNIEDELVFSNSLQSPAKPGTIYNQIRPPRTYGVRATVRF